MRRFSITCRSTLALAAVVAIATAASQVAGQQSGSPSDAEAGCRALTDFPALEVTLAEFRTAAKAQQPFCHVRGRIAPGIRYHVQLPLPSKWNGRLLVLGDGGKDGAVTSTPNAFVESRVLEGYAVVNSNSGHDAVTEPNSSFGFNNRQAEIDYGYRAVHLSTVAAKALAASYYRRAPARSYFDGCSAGGRQGLMEAQRFPDDFDGIAAGAPANYFQANHLHRIAVLQKLFATQFGANLAFDADKDGVPEDLSKVTLLEKEVLAKCDALDGINDGVIDDPTSCTFSPATDLSRFLCAGDVNGPSCFTRSQIRTIDTIYDGPHTSGDVRISKGLARGSESTWAAAVIPHAGNKLQPAYLGNVGDYPNYLFYEIDPGIAPADWSKTTQPLASGEYGWWQFPIDDVAAGKGKVMSQITDAKDPDLTKFVSNPARKLLLYHGWSDPMIPPEPTLDYYREVVERTFKGNVDAARKQARLFMFPGMAHCGGGPGPNQWGDTLARLVDWVENDKPPDFLIAEHRTKGAVDNERKVCAYPQRAVYTGPAGQQNDRANWKAVNFECR
jgi:feruloyl esterase